MTIIAPPPPESPNPVDVATRQHPVEIAHGSGRRDAKRWYHRRAVAIDLFVVVVAIALAQAATAWAMADRYHDSTIGLGSSALLGLALAGTWAISLAAFHTRDVALVDAGSEEYRRVVLATVAVFGLGTMLVTTGATFGITLYSNIHESFPVQVWSLISLLAGSAGLPLGRYLLRRILGRRRARGELVPRVLALGTPRSVAHFCQSLAQSTPLGYSVTGVCVPQFDGNLGSVLDTVVGSVPVLGDEESVELALRVTGADALVVTSLDQIDPDRLRMLAWTLDSLEVDMILVPGLMDVAASRVKLRPIHNLPAVRIDRPRYDGPPALGKRLFDIAVGLTALVATAPLLVLAAVAIRLDDGGPVIFRQTRVGHRGKIFRIFKFRTMMVDADAKKGAEVANACSTNAVFFKSAADSRITRIGRYLRATSIDELPQLLNVLGGSMSLVGPRPLVHGEGASVEHFIERRGLVKPGMTGLWQVSGRSDVSDDERVRLDHSYVDNWSSSQDFMIIMATVRAVLQRKGAY